MNGTVLLLEYVGHSGALEVDAEQAVIRGVRILGLQSANGREYLREGVAKARDLYEGKQVNADHPSKPGEAVPIGRRLGWLEAVKQDHDGGLRGNLHLLKAHPMTAVILEAAAKRPQLMGLSHNAQGKTRRENGREIVESIEAVHSVDLVADPATVSGLAEGKNVKRTLKQLIEDLKASRPAYAKVLKEYADSGVVSPDAQMDDPAPKGEDDAADHELALKQGFRAAVLAALDDDSMDLKAKLKKIGEILKMEEKMLAKDEGGDDDAPAEPAAAEESRKLKLEVAGLKLLMEAGVKPSKVLTKALAGCTSEAEMKGLIEEAKSARPTGGARSAAPGNWTGTTPVGTDGKPITEQKAPEGDVKALGTWLRS